MFLWQCSFIFVFTWNCGAFVEHPRIWIVGSSPGKASTSSLFFSHHLRRHSHHHHHHHYPCILVVNNWFLQIHYCYPQTRWNPSHDDDLLSNDNHRFASRLLQLDLDGVELLVDDVHLVITIITIWTIIVDNVDDNVDLYEDHHAFYLFWCDRPSTGLLSEQVHHMGCELLTALQIELSIISTSSWPIFCTDLVIFFQLLVVDVPNLTKLCLVVTVLYWGLWREGWGWREAFRFEKLPSNPNITRLKGRILGLSTFLWVWALWIFLISIILSIL